MCSVCQAEQGEGQVRYVVRSAGGRSQGPFSREQVVDQLRKKLVTGADRIAVEGNDWEQIDQHADFLGYFIPGDPLYDAIHQLQKAETQKISSRRRREWFGGMGKAGLVAAVLAVPVVLYALDVEIVPDSLVEALKGGTEESLDKLGRTISKAVDQEAAERELQEQLGLPGEDVVAEIRAAWPDATSPVDQRLALADRGMLQGTQAGIENARRELEYAVSAEDQNVGALAALAVVYSTLHDSDNQLQTRALELYNRAQAIDEDHVAVLRAQAGMSVVSNAWDDAEDKARVCLEAIPDDGICNWHLGHALTQLGKFDEAEVALRKAKEAMEDAPVIDLALGEAALETHQYAAAIGPLTAFSERYPDDPGIHELLARYHREVGHWDQAIASGRRATELDPESLDGRYIAGALLLHQKKDPQAAWALLKGLGTSKEIEGREVRADILLQECLAATASKDIEGATDVCVRLTEHSTGWAPGQLAETWAWHMAGDAGRAEDALKLADITSIEGDELARFHMEAGRYYQTVKRERAALFEYGHAVEASEHYPDSRFVDAQARLAVGNSREALTLIESTWTMDWSIEPQRDPIVQIPRGPVDFEAIATSAQSSIPAGDPLFGELPSVVGILEAQVCLRTGKGCSRARTVLKGALSHEDTSLAVRAYLGHIAIKDQRWSEAVDYYTVVLGSKAAEPVLHSLLGLAFAQLDKAAEAESQLGAASKHGSGVTGLKRRNVLALVALGERDEAVEMARQAIADDPKDYVSKALLLDLEQ